MNEHRKRRTGTFLTLEAAMIFPIILIVLGLCVRYTFLMHDSILGKAVLNEVLERCGHQSQEAEDEIIENGEALLQNMLSQKKPELRVEGEAPSREGEITARDYSFRMKDRGFAPEAMMRTMTLCDLIPRSKGKDTEKKDEE